MNITLTVGGILCAIEKALICVNHDILCFLYKVSWFNG